LKRSGILEPNAISLYNSNIARQRNFRFVNTFQFYRYRFWFRALEETYFPRGKSGNVIRGALGLALRATASPDEYARLFEPRAAAGAPSGFHDLPRPFVVRAADLDGSALQPGERFCVNIHSFDIRRPALRSFSDAFGLWEKSGIGPRRGRVRLEEASPLDLEGAPLEAGPGHAFCSISLEADPVPVERAVVRFVSPTELKTAGVVADRPEFGILFTRLRDRIGALRALYSGGPLPIAFREMGERASAVRLRRLQIEWERAQRTSRRTGQTHPLGGFVGEAEYEGDLAEFMPWLRCGRWSGVGRQTVWGKGDIRCESVSQTV
jgi:hypothetical protein